MHSKTLLAYFKTSLAAS